MEIITQNYEKILENLIINNFSEIIKESKSKLTTDNQVFNYISILDTLDNKICEIALKSLKTIIESIDRGYKNSHERKHKYYIKARCKRTIMTIFGEITYNKTIYSNKYNEGSYCFIDEYLGLKKYDYFDPYIKATIIEYAANNSSPKVAKILNDMIGKHIKLDKAHPIISRQTIRNIILKSKLSNPEIKELETKDDLYIMADEKWVHTQNNNNEDVMVKEIVVFDGREENKKKTKLLNKYSFTSFNNNNFLNECLDYLYYVYDMDKIKNIYVMGDGATWIRKLTAHFKVNSQTNVTFNLDKFHFKQAIHHLFLNESLEKIAVSYILNNDKDDFKELCEEMIKENPYRTETIETKKEYILNNWNYINNLYKNKLKCPMESQISHTLADLLTSRPKAYSIKTLNKILKIRLLYKNNHNIKQLYLNNYNKKDILTISAEHLNYEIFNKNNNYQINNKMIPINYHPGFHPDNTLNYNIRL